MRLPCVRTTLMAAIVQTAGLMVSPAGASTVGPEAPGPNGLVPFGPPPTGMPVGPRAWLGDLGMLLNLVFIGSLIVLVWRIVAAIPRWRRGDEAIRLLREQYARGDIDEQVYRTRMAALR